MQYLVFATLPDGLWVPQVLNEANGTFYPAPSDFFYSSIYRIDGIDYINEAYVHGTLIYSRVLSIYSLTPALTLGTTQYYQLGEVVQYAPSLNPPPIQFVHHSASAAYDPYVFYTWLNGCSPQSRYMLDMWQWHWLHDQLREQQNRAEGAEHAFRSLRYKTRVKEKDSQKILGEVLYKVGELEQQIKKASEKAPDKAPEKSKKAAPKAKKPADDRAAAAAKQQQERQNLVMYVIAQFNVLHMIPDNASKIYDLFENLNIRADEQDQVVNALDINAKACNMYILAFHKQKIHNNVRVCFLKKLATYSDAEHAAYFIEDPNVVPKIIKAIQDIKTDDSVKADLLKKYTTLQSEAAKKYDETVLKPQRDIEKAINELDFAAYQALAKDSEALQKHAAVLFTKALKNYSKAAYEYAPTEGVKPAFYAVLIKFVAEFDVNILDILKNNYCPQLKLAALHKLADMQKTASPQEFFKLDHEFESGVLGLYAQNCAAAALQDPALQQKLEELQVITAEFYELQFKQILAIFEGQSQGKIDTSLLPLFAKRTNSQQQTVLMLAIKHGYAYKVLKPIFEAAGDTIFARDDSGLTVLHYLARYYQGTDLAFLNKFSKRHDILCVSELKTDETYLHHLVRYKKQDLIIMFMEALQDSSKAVFAENAKGETVTNLLDEKETEYDEARKAIHDLIIKNFTVETLEGDSEMTVAHALFSSNGSEKLADYAKNNPKRLIEMFNGWSKLIDSVEKRFKGPQKVGYVHPGNLYRYDGHSLHWHLTETLLDSKWQHLEQDYLDSYYYKNCPDITVTDTLVFKQISYINYDPMAAKKISSSKRLSESEMAIKKLANFFLYKAHDTKQSKFLQVVVAQPKLVVPLAMLYVIAIKEEFTFLENLADAVSIQLFVPENMELINKFANSLPEEVREATVVYELASMYLGRLDLRFLHKPMIAPNYQALRTLIANNKSAVSQKQIMYCIDRIAENYVGMGVVGGIEGIGGVISEFTKAGCPELVAFMLNYLTTESEYVPIAMYLATTSHSSADCQTVCKYIDDIKTAQQKTRFIGRLVYFAAINNNLALLTAVFEKTLYRLNIATTVSAATYSNAPYTGISFLLHEMFRNISREPAATQSTILKDLYLGLERLGSGKDKLFMTALKENSERSGEFKIAEGAFKHIQNLDEVMSKTGAQGMSMLTSATSWLSVAATAKPKDGAGAPKDKPKRSSLLHKN